MKLLVLNGPNINMIGIREKHIYGAQTYQSGMQEVHSLCNSFNIDVEIYQSNHEGDLVDKIQEAYFAGADGIVINPGAYTHTSIALLDVVLSVNIPTVEVHISKIEEREDFRQISYIRRACVATVSGKGLEGYLEACDILIGGKK